MFGGECCGVVVYPGVGFGGVGGGDHCGGGLRLTVYGVRLLVCLVSLLQGLRKGVWVW